MFTTVHIRVCDSGSTTKRNVHSIQSTPSPLSPKSHCQIPAHLLLFLLSHPLVFSRLSLSKLSLQSMRSGSKVYTSPPRYLKALNAALQLRSSNSTLPNFDRNTSMFDICNSNARNAMRSIQQ